MTPEGFWSNTREDGACVVWTAGQSEGYGAVEWEGAPNRAHRVAFFLRMGRWPEPIGRHLCHNRLCVLHVVDGTFSENNRDIVVSGLHHNARKTHCPRSHPYDEENTRSVRGVRYCRACDRARGQARRERRLARVA